MTKRFLDILMCVLFLPVLLPIIILIYVLIKIEDGGNSLHWSKRVGLNSKVFLMPKFRSMKINTPQVATHLLENPDQYITQVGKILRKSSLDELPQLWSVIFGEMSFVGPRPALFNQYDLIELRKLKKIDLIKPGVTGWAQINGRDELPISVKVEFDYYYLKNMSVSLDFKILLLTVFKVFKSEGVSH